MERSCGYAAGLSLGRNSVGERAETRESVFTCRDLVTDWADQLQAVARTGLF
jgi:hypothetical protein